ncbi:MAG: hypothetical protein ACD_40C00068G0001, partial [uncultured bacterium]
MAVEGRRREKPVVVTSIIVAWVPSERKVRSELALVGEIWTSGGVGKGWGKIT